MNLEKLNCESVCVVVYEFSVEFGLIIFCFDEVDDDGDFYGEFDYEVDYEFYFYFVVKLKCVCIVL